jgi:alkanesulfonate monooxygenase SsuD/methylene tetrahydromethanopterin reductase-like flavin-dependent oxidoreductase (luciferase family)
MIALGYKLSSEEHSAIDLVRQAQMAQDAGFGFALISDHYHPWIERQGQSPFVWSVLGAIAQATQRLTVGTAVTVGTSRSENARLYSLPDPAPPLYVAVGGPCSADLAARLGDGMIGTDPEASLLAAFDRAGGAGKPRYGELTVCWAKDEATARRTAREHWPTSAMESSLSWELPLPEHFEAVAALVTEDQVAESIICGPDPEHHLAAIRKYAAAGYDHVCIHQVGKEQKGFFEFYAEEILPRLKSVAAPRRKKAARKGRAR